MTGKRIRCSLQEDVCSKVNPLDMLIVIANFCVMWLNGRWCRDTTEVFYWVERSCCKSHSKTHLKCNSQFELQNDTDEKVLGEMENSTRVQKTEKGMTRLSLCSSRFILCCVAQFQMVVAVKFHKKRVCKKFFKEWRTWQPIHREKRRKNAVALHHWSLGLYYKVLMVS